MDSGPSTKHVDLHITTARNQECVHDFAVIL